ncbi:MAG: prepilin-type N-terminal cleavage/methylation domain-containing protein [Smithella sp.]|jgi:prepilin-type N-terminal cleavage/methylation domain-containing protein
MNRIDKKNGFTIIELLIVIILVGMVLSVALPVSYGMYETYKASLRAQEVMTYVSGLRRDAFLYSERKVLSSQDGNMTVDGGKKIFKEMGVHISEPIVFFRNGTSSGGVIELSVGDVVQNLVVKTPLGDLSLERSGT